MNNEGRVRVCAYAFQPGVPPAEIKLWNRGDNPTDYGVHRWTARSVAEVLGEYEKRGNPLQIDVEHNAAEPPKDPADIGPTGGYARLEVRDGEPWLVFDWSEFACEQLRSKQRRFLSPEYDVDKSTGEIVRLVRVSLVGDPGTHNARMLASSAERRAQAQRSSVLASSAVERRMRAGRTSMLDPIMKAAIGAAMKAQDPKKALEELVAELGDSIEPAVRAALAAASKAEDVKGAVDALLAELGDAADQAPPSSQAAGSDQGEDKPVAAAEGMPSAEEKKEAGRMAASATRTPSVTEDEKNLAKRVAELEKERIEREGAERFTAASGRIPASLHGFARKLATAGGQEWDEFVAGFPAAKGGGGVKASSQRSQGEVGTVRASRVPDEDQKALDRVFASSKRLDTPFTMSRGGGVVATHLFRVRPGLDPNKLVQSVHKEA